jgi:hypothetical protein
MKNSIATLATAATLLAASFNPATAKGTDVALTQNDWNAISEQAEIENATEIDEIPVVIYELTKSDWENIEISTEEAALINSLPSAEEKQTALKVSLKSGKTTTLVLNAPFVDSEMIGLAVIDASGKVVSSTVGNYADLQQVLIPEQRSETYVVRVYSASKVFETKVQVVFL